MKKILVSLFLLIVSCSSLKAIDIKIKYDSTKQQKYSLFFNARIDAYGYFDSYAGVESQNGLVYYMPARPDIDSETGLDLNYDLAPTTRFSIAATRLAMGGTIEFNDKNSVEALIEVDFLGTNTASINTFRMRHAYAKLNLGNSSILFGQTSHLAVCDENLPGVVSSGAGFPYSVTIRPVQFAFSQRFLDNNLELSASASMFGGSELDYQNRSMTPDFSLKVRYGDVSSSNVSLFGGYRVLQIDGYDNRMEAFYGGLSMKWDLGGGYMLRGMGVYGADMSSFLILGGYATSDQIEDVAVPLNSMSSYVDFSTPRFSGFEFGAFYGYQANMGAASSVDVSSVVGSPAVGVNSYWTLAPRVWYHYKSVSFGLEYVYSESNWMDHSSTTSGYQATEYYKGIGDGVITRNNRYVLLCRFTL